MVRQSQSLLGTALFVFYCAAVGIYLLLRPWSAHSAHVGVPGSGFFKGFVSGLGLIHLAAAAADLRLLSRQAAAGTGTEEGAP